MVKLGDALIVGVCRDGRVRIFEWPKVNGSGTKGWEAVCSLIAGEDDSEPDDVVRVRANYLEANPVDGGGGQDFPVGVITTAPITFGERLQLTELKHLMCEVFVLMRDSDHLLVCPRCGWWTHVGKP